MRGGDASARALFRDLLLEAVGRVLEIPDGPLRPLALLALPRVLEARRIVGEEIATRDGVAEIWGEDALRDAEEWSGAMLRHTAEAMDALLGTALLDGLALERESA